MTKADRLWALSILWSSAREVYPYFDRLDLDWDADYREYLPKLMQETDDYPSWLLLCEFVRLLNDGHTTVSLPKDMVSGFGFFPFRFRHVGNHFLITEAPQKENLLLEALGVDDVSMDDWVQRLNRWQYTANGHPYFGRLESWMPLMLPGKSHTLHTDAGDIPFQYLPEKPSLLKAADPISRYPFRILSDSIRLFDPGILCARMDDLQRLDQADEFQKILQETKPKAVLFDIRRNIGGMTLCGAKYAQPFFSGSFGGCSKWTQHRKAVDAAGASQLSGMSDAAAQRLMERGIVSRQDFEDAQEYARHTRYERYRDEWENTAPFHDLECPVALLTSRDTISAAEDFACFFKFSKRGTILGEPTFGSTGSPLIVPLPNGGRGQIVSVGYTLADGTPFIGCGIQPDLSLTGDADAYRNRIDQALDAALEYLRNKC